MTTTTDRKLSPSERALANAPDHFRAVVAPMDSRSQAAKRQRKVSWAVVTPWLDPEAPGTNADLASYRSLGGSAIYTARDFRASFCWEAGAWVRA